MDIERNIWLACGGTGGHFVPGKVIGQQLQSLGLNPIYWGEGKAIEKVLSESHNIHLQRPPTGSGRMKRLLQLWKMMGLEKKKQKPMACLLFGGFTSLALGLYAKFNGIPIYMFEQNAIPGRINRLLSRWVRIAFLSFPVEEGLLKTKQQELTGNPVRQNKQTSEFEYDVLILGGSQGAKAINEQLPSQIPRGLRVCHIAGPGKKEAAVKAYQNHEFAKLNILEHSGDVPALITRSRWVISRAGATSLSEIAAAGKALIAIPYPYAKDDHQRANAKVLENKGACIILEESELRESQRLLDDCLKNEQKNHQLCDAIQKSGLADIDGSRAIACLKREALFSNLKSQETSLV